MNNIIKRGISLILALAMMSIPVFAIVPPEDAVPFMSFEEQMSARTNEILQIRLRLKNGTNLSQNERAELIARENTLTEELEDLGVTKMKPREAALYLGYQDEIENAEPMFEGLMSDDYDFWVSLPNTYLYYGETIYYVIVEVTPLLGSEHLWGASDTFYLDDGLFTSYCDIPLTTSPSSQSSTARELFSDMGTTAGSYEYTVKVSTATSVKYYYVGTEESNDMSSYTLGLVTTAVVCNEDHILDGGDSVRSDSKTVYDNYYVGAMEYIMHDFYEGGGYEVRYPMTIYYYFGNEYKGGLDVYPPFTWPYMYT